MEIIELELQKIKRDNNQPRQNIDETKVREMSQSIKTEGVINAIEIDKDYIIITGEMRYRAARMAGLKTIPCKVIAINAKERFRRQVIENIHHNTMTDWDTAVALKKLVDDFPTKPGLVGTHGGKPNLGYAELANIIGKSSQYISEKFDLLNASHTFQKAVKEGLPSTFIRVVNSTPIEYRDEIEQKIISGEIQSRDAGLRIADALKRRPDIADKILAIDYSQYEDVHETTVALGKIAPQRSDLIKKSFDNTNEFSERITLLIEWMKQNPPTIIGSIHVAEIILGFKVLFDAITAWNKQAKQLKAKGK